jgi:hypothetical protein
LTPPLPSFNDAAAAFFQRCCRAAFFQRHCRRLLSMMPCFSTARPSCHLYVLARACTHFPTTYVMVAESLRLLPIWARTRSYYYHGRYQKPCLGSKVFFFFFSHALTLVGTLDSDRLPPPCHLTCWLAPRDDATLHSDSCQFQRRFPTP